MYTTTPPITPPSSKSPRIGGFRGPTHPRTNTPFLRIFTHQKNNPDDRNLFLRNYLKPGGMGVGIAVDPRWLAPCLFNVLAPILGDFESVGGGLVGFWERSLSEDFCDLLYDLFQVLHHFFVAKPDHLIPIALNFLGTDRVLFLAIVMDRTI
jgi:hypothetical protein